MPQKIWSLYRITNKINGKVYIGQASNVSKRWSDHKRFAKNNKPKQAIHHAIIKYGLDNFEFEVIASCISQDATNETEMELVKQYDSFISDGRGYNATLGGFNSPISDETKQKMSLAKRGISFSEEHSENISKAKKGKPAHNKDKPISESVKQKISKSRQGIIFSEEHKIALSKAGSGKKKSEESKQKMRKPKSEEAKKNMSIARKKYLANKLGVGN